MSVAVPVIEPTVSDIEADVDAAIEACGGDMRSALRATLIANAYIDFQNERLKAMISAGYGRGRGRAHSAPAEGLIRAANRT